MQWGIVAVRVTWIWLSVVWYTWLEAPWQLLPLLGPTPVLFCFWVTLPKLSISLYAYSRHVWRVVAVCLFAGTPGKWQFPVFKGESCFVGDFILNAISSGGFCTNCMNQKSLWGASWNSQFALSLTAPSVFYDCLVSLVPLFSLISLFSCPIWFSCQLLRNCHHSAEGQLFGAENRELLKLRNTFWENNVRRVSVGNCWKGRWIEVNFIVPQAGLSLLISRSFFIKKVF